MAHNITITGVETQNIVEIVAALELGNKRLESITVSLARTIFLQPIREDHQHYLFLRDANDHMSFFGCGSAQGAIDTMTEDGKLLHLLAWPKDQCPNHKED